MARKEMTLGERMKCMENTHKVPPFQSYLVRADGHRFCKFTQGFHKPFDVVFQRAMVKTANGLLDFFLPATVFVCSDEITLIFSPICSEETYKQLVESGEKTNPAHQFSGRHNKIETLVSSKASVLFNNFIVEEIENKLSESPDFYTKSFIERVEGRNAIFDARLIPIPLGDEQEIVNNLIWRSCYDCHRNTISSYARHVLGKSKVVNKNSTEMKTMMKEEHKFDFDADVAEAEKFGVFCKKMQCLLTNDRGEEYTRYKHFDFTVNLNKENHDKALQLLLDKYFTNGLLSSSKEYLL